MVIRKKLFTLLFLILSIFSFSQDKITNSKDLISGELKNGMKYYIYKNEMPHNRVAVNVLVRAGSLQEDDDQQGMAHLIEHLCFNGTEKYDKNEVIKYYQSIGMNFGGDLNAHTSFSETVYKIEIPTNDKEKFEQGIEVLEEMTLKPTFKQEEIDSEKYIVQEEWRLGQGLNGRITKFFQKSLFDNSRYGERFPIGKMDIVLGSKRNVIKRFYDKWYHPKNMAVVMVGDIDPKYAKEVITKYFDVKTDREYTKRPEYKLAEMKENKYLVFKDKELPYVMFDMTNVTPLDRHDGRAYYKRLLFTGVLQDRFTRKTKSGKVSLIDGGFYDSKYGNQQLNTYYTVLNKNKISEGIKDSIDILKDLAVNKVTPEELNIQKENLRKIFELSVKTKDSITSSHIIRSVRKVFLDDDVFINSSDNLKYYNEMVDNITPQEINEMAMEFYNSKKTSLLFAPEVEGVKVPDGKELENIIVNQEKKAVKKRAKVNYDLKLNKPRLVKGKVTGEKDLKTCKKFTLSNGIEFLYKKTDLEKDKVYIVFEKEEGSLFDNKKEYINSQFIEIIPKSGFGNINYEDIETFRSDKSFKVIPYITTFNQGVALSSDKKDLTTALDVMRYLLLKPKFSNKDYEYTMTAQKDILENRLNSPGSAFSDKITEVFFKNNLKKRSLTVDDLKLVNKKDIMKEYKSKFSNFYGFRGTILGSIDEKEAKELLENYFAGLPVKTIKKSCGREWLDIKYPEGVVRSKVVKGKDEKVSVGIYYPIHKRYIDEDGYKVRMFAEILKMQLTEEVREKLGGVYGVGVATKYTRHERPYMQIMFATDPKRVDEVSAAIKKEVSKLANGNIKDEFLNSIIKNYKLTYESEQNRNGYWLFYLERKIKVGDDYEPYTPEEYKEVMTKENLKEFFNGMVGNDNYTEIKLVPKIEG